MKVSIIILCWNHLEDVTKPFVKEIEKTQGIDYELVFVDNGQDDDSASYLREYFKNSKNVQILKPEDNLGFAQGNNFAFEFTSGEYVCFLNNDVVINDPLWLKKMVDYLETKEKTIIGAEEVVDQPVAIWNDKIIPYLNGWCILAPRKFLTKYGKFHRAFKTPYLEDTEFCARAKYYGWDWEVFPVDIKHLGARSTFDQLDMWGTTQVSRQTFMKLMQELEKPHKIEDYLIKEFE